MSNYDFFTYNNVDKSVVLGKGGYAIVYGTKKGNYACKYFGKYEETEYEYYKNILTELTIMKTLKFSPHVIDYAGKIFKTNSNGYFMLKYDGCLTTQLNIKNKFSYTKCKKILYQILLGLYDAHSRFICHADIKPENILIDKNDNIVISDWGISEFMMCSKTKDMCHTTWYQAPEILLGDNKYDFKVDIWSTALTFIEILTGKLLFQGETKIDHLYKIFDIFGTPDNKTWPNFDLLPGYKNNFPKHLHQKDYLRNIIDESDMLDLIQNMLILNPRQRYSVSQSLNHRVFDDLRQNKFDDIESFQFIVRELSINPDYMNFQEEIVEKYRILILDWLAEILIECDLNYNVYILSVYYMDYFLSHCLIKKEKLQLVCIVCFYLAQIICVKNNESIENFLGFCCYSYTTYEFLEILDKIIKCLEYNLYYNVPYTFYLEKFSNRMEMNKEKYKISLYIFINSLRLYEYIKHDFKLLIIASCILSKYSNENNIDSLDKYLQNFQITKEDQKSLINCIKFLIKSHGKKTIFYEHFSPPSLNFDVIQKYLSDV